MIINVTAPDINARRAHRDRFEIGSVNESIAMLQVARDLFLAVTDFLRFGAAPGANRIRNLDARGQSRARVDRRGCDVTGGTDAVVVTRTQLRAGRRTFAAQTVAK